MIRVRHGDNEINVYEKGSAHESMRTIMNTKSFYNNNALHLLINHLATIGLISSVRSWGNISY